MGRAGSGVGGGGHSGGGHSSGRSSGGHRVSPGSSGGGRRAGSGGSTSSSRSFSSSSSHSFSSSGPSRNHSSSSGSLGDIVGLLVGLGIEAGSSSRSSRDRYSGGYTKYRKKRRSKFGYVVAVIVILIILFLVLGSESSAGSQNSTIVRTKLKSVSGFDNNCVIDELGWVDNVSKTETRLKEFFNETGVQPYILLRDYDASLATDMEKETWAIEYYDTNISREDAFLFVYFAEEDTDNDVGYMAYVNGSMTASVMDAEAVNIFWGYLDRYWYTNMSTDDVLVSAFTDTGKTIMKVPTNVWDVLKTIVKFVGIVAVLIIVLIIVIIKVQRAREKAREDQRILETDINNYLK